MAGLHVDEIRNAAGTGPAPLYRQYADKIWANLNGTGTIALRDSKNIASVTDNGTGDYTFNYTLNMANANYGISWGVSLPSSVVATFMPAAPAVSTFRVASYRPDTSAITDASYVMPKMQGDLA